MTVLLLQAVEQPVMEIDVRLRIRGLLPSQMPHSLETHTTSPVRWPDNKKDLVQVARRAMALLCGLELESIYLSYPRYARQFQC